VAPRTDGGRRRPRGGVPAARQALAVLQAMARQSGPVPAAALARDLGVPRSTMYHLLAELVATGFVVHLPEERRYGLGVSAFELGSAYMRQEPLARLARPVLSRLVDAVGHTAHLAVLHGREVLYVVEERAPGRPPLVTDVGVRLPAQLTASGRAVLAHLPAVQVRALFPDPSAFVERHGTGPTSLSALRRVLSEVRRRGYATEDGQVTPGFASVATAVFDHSGHPVAGAAVTFPAEALDAAARHRVALRVARAATELTRRFGGSPPTSGSPTGAGGPTSCSVVPAPQSPASGAAAPCGPRVPQA
jgi:DNA-binding IclR family transcriptional regulator